MTTSPLRRADWRAALTPHAMPIVSLKTGLTVAYEVLARWDIDGRYVTPDIAFRCGADEDETSLAILEAVASHLATGVHLSVNVTEAVLTDPSVQSDFQGVGSGLTLEILETVPMESHSVIRAVRQWRSSGVRVAIDDFGTGHANAEAVLLLQPDIVKTESSALRDETGQVIRTASLLAKQVGASLTVEGVETRQHVEMAKRFGADSGQGWWFGRPVPIRDL